jgi:hypothetical protein
MFLNVSNLNLNVMNAKKEIPSPDDLLPYYQDNRRISLLVIWFTISGILVSVLWLGLLVAGLLVDSSYYRAAISFRFAGCIDWILAIVTFTFSNVVLLAFTSGLLGGITSKMLYTNGFKISKYGYKKANPYQVENPFISAFRGMFVFIAILFMQYVSTFSDLGAINKTSRDEQTAVTTKYEKLYSKIAEKEKDTLILTEMRSEINKLIASENLAEPDTSLINKIIAFKADLRELSGKDSLNGFEWGQKKYKELKIQDLRRTLKVPSNSDFSGIGLTSFSYFKFAVIVSFLAFVFGYDPSLFADFIGKIFKRLDDNNPPQNPK